jgi:hypothetical protein
VKIVPSQSDLVETRSAEAELTIPHVDTKRGPIIEPVPLAKPDVVIVDKRARSQRPGGGPKRDIVDRGRITGPGNGPKRDIMDRGRITGPGNGPKRDIVDRGRITGPGHGPKRDIMDRGRIIGAGSGPKRRNIIQRASEYIFGS